MRSFFLSFFLPYPPPMALELLDYNRLSTLERDRDAKEAASAGLESMQTLIHLLSSHKLQQQQQQQQQQQEQD